jgi:hypothetical protein
MAAARTRTAKTVETRERSVLDDTLATSQSKTEPIDGVLIGRVSAIDADGTVRVDLPYPRFTDPLAVRTTVALGSDTIGREVAVVFERGRSDKPLVIGLVHATPSSLPRFERREVEMDGDRLVLTADREIVLRCGKASITLTRAGKVLIRGEYVLSHSGGVNRIRGGSIQLN